MKTHNYKKVFLLATGILFLCTTFGQISPDGSGGPYAEVLDVLPTSYTFSYSGGSTEFNVRIAGSAYNDYWTVTDFFWLSIENKNHKGFTLRAKPNTTTDPRSTTIRVGDMYIPIKQKASPPDMPSLIKGPSSGCSGENLTYSVSNPEPDREYKWEIEGDAYFASGKSTGTTVTVNLVGKTYLKPQTMILKVKAHKNGMSSQARTKTITLRSFPAASINGPTNISPADDPVEYRALVQDGVTYKWSADGFDIFPPDDYDGGYGGMFEQSSVQIWADEIGQGTLRLRVKNVCGTNSTSKKITVGHMTQLSDENYIFTREARIPAKDIDDLKYAQITQNVQYLDGLGRPMQKIAIGQSPGQRDMVTPITYDALGRRAKEYMTYPIYKADGQFQKNAVKDQEENLGGIFSKETGGRFYTENYFDGSPLNQIVEVAQPGDSWSKESGHTIKTARGSNTDGEVRIWRIGHNEQLQVGQEGHYREGELYLTVIKDENWKSSTPQLHTVREYRNKSGQVVLKRTYTKDDTLSTYFVYDRSGLLRYVIPPKANGDAGDLSQETIKMLCYEYKYDGRKRMIYKKLPGAEPVLMVYDKWDRLVLTQDGNQRRNSKWTNLEYDHLNRQIRTYELKISDFYEKLRDDFMSSDDRNKRPKGYGSTLTITYYDNYDFIEKYSNRKLNYSAADLPKSQPFKGSHNTNVKGQVTGHYVLIDEDASAGFYSAIFYDEKYRVIQTTAENIEGNSRESTAYDFAGKPLCTVLEQSNNINKPKVFITKTMTYDHAGRLKTIKMHKGSTPENPTQLLVSNTYDKLGRLEKKELHGGVQEIAYEYNVRGWLTHINNPRWGTSDKKLFNMELMYTSGMSELNAAPQYNGNIAAMKWGVHLAENNGKRAYGFKYDALNRLTAARYGEGKNYSLKGGHDMGAKYDINGNIFKLYRVGKDETDWDTIDDLVYRYNGNQLKSVVDWGLYDRYGYIDGANNPANSGGYQAFKDKVDDLQEYAYDPNGNMTRDDNKGITKVEYNHLNLPTKINIAGKGRIEYFYDGAGAKFEKSVYNSDGSWNRGASRFYVGDFVYDGYDKLVQIFHEEGYIDGQGSWHYFLKDHLGNVRVDFVAEGGKAINVQDYHYFPFGMAFPDLEQSVSDNQFKYNGKELQEDHELNWYDYGARFYDPALGRFHTQDRFATKYYGLTPYNYTAGNPIRFIDVNGDSIQFANNQRFWFKVKAVVHVAVNSLLSSTYRKSIKTLMDSPNVFKIAETNGKPKFRSNSLAWREGNKPDPSAFEVFKGGEFTTDHEALDKAWGNYNTEVKNHENEKNGVGDGGTLYLNLSGKYKSYLKSLANHNGYETTLGVNSGHELSHALDANYGIKRVGDTNRNGVQDFEDDAVQFERIITFDINRRNVLKRLTPRPKYNLKRLDEQ